MPKFEVFGHFLEFESLDFLDFAYYDRQAWYLRGRSDLLTCFSKTTKNRISLKFSILRSGYIKRGKIEVS